MKPDIADIDRAVEELERLAAGEEMPAEQEAADQPRIPMWLKIVAAGVVLDLVVRLFVPASERVVLLLEAALLLTVATAIGLPLIKEPALVMAGKSRLRLGLAVVVFLGAVRSALWGLGLPVQLANLVILVLGVLGLAGYLWLRRRAGAKAETPDQP